MKLAVHLVLKDALLDCLLRLRTTSPNFNPYFTGDLLG